MGKSPSFPGKIPMENGWIFPWPGWFFPGVFSIHWRCEMDSGCPRSLQQGGWWIVGIQGSRALSGYGTLHPQHLRSKWRFLMEIDLERMPYQREKPPFLGFRERFSICFPLNLAPTIYILHIWNCDLWVLAHHPRDSVLDFTRQLIGMQTPAIVNHWRRPSGHRNCGFYKNRRPICPPKTSWISGQIWSNELFIGCL